MRSHRVCAVILAAVLATAGAACGGSEDDTPPRSGGTPPDAEQQQERDRLKDLARDAEKAAGTKAAEKPRKKSPTFTGPVLGADVSWPQCPKGTGIPQRRGKGLPPPEKDARYVVIGLTNGPGFTPNPCIEEQLAWAERNHVMVAAYSVTSWPAADRPGGTRHPGPFDASTSAGRLANTGFSQARFNIATMQRVGLRTPVVWVDVEPYPVFPWSDDVTANAQVVRGAVRGYEEAGYRVGVYSTQALWEQVVGDLRFGLPEWRAAGQTSRAEAARRCAPDRSFQGGRAVMAQWTDGRRDFNITCFDTHLAMDRWFRQH